MNMKILALSNLLDISFFSPGDTLSPTFSMQILMSYLNSKLVVKKR